MDSFEFGWGAPKEGESLLLATEIMIGFHDPIDGLSLSRSVSFPIRKSAEK